MYKGRASLSHAPSRPLNAIPDPDLDLRPGAVCWVEGPYIPKVLLCVIAPYHHQPPAPGNGGMAVARAGRAA
jgi:hypothetical protein